ncbi:MAG: PQQ-dependent sugar dehydrogenase [Anaerolineae bacterium]|nr:PQQ-dependent sugar dehydrogenase [Anaerolineae bacterium]
MSVFNVIRPFLLRPASQAAEFRLVTVAEGFTRPLYLTHAGDARLFVVEQDGLIKIIADGKVLAEPFLDVSALVSRDGSERGLLGLAFHPDYPSNGHFFINYTDLNGNTVVARYSVSADDPDLADPASAVVILNVAQPYPNHNAGQLAFGPDRYLYIGLGDGGSANDPQGNGQNPAALLGKMLRVDVNSEPPYSIPADNPFLNDGQFASEIWAWGLRNPWRYSFDRQTGDLYIADVGQNQIEEVNFQSATSRGGENYGWNVFEGTQRLAEVSTLSGAVMPVTQYDHTEGCSITGGYVYRGQNITSLVGEYLFGDFCAGTIWGLRRDAAGKWTRRTLMNSGRVISSFGEDYSGELYSIDYGGAILRFDALP